MFKKSIGILVILMILICIFLILLSVHQAKNIHREPSALMNKYYRLKTTNPVAAHQALLILLAQDSTYQPAVREASLLSGRDEKTLAKQTQLALVSYFPPIQISVNISNPETLPSQSIMPPASLASVLPSISYRTKLKEAGFLALEQNRLSTAIDYFTKAYALLPEPRLAMQLGYIYDKTNNKPAAYQSFKLATQSTNKALALRANNAMTSLAGLQTKALPSPYFSEVFFNPFSESRFGLTVTPFVARLGIEQNSALQTKQYIVFRRTDDNKSMNLGQISQIYEDNVQITGVGTQITPIKNIPIIGFIETGAAYDLVYRNRNRWRGDLRAGFMYYNEFCAKPTYVDKLILGTHYYSDLYAEATYFTRYDNLISGVKSHQGIRLLQYHSTMINLYATGRMLADTQREFFNNFAEIGPGLEFIPTNRFNIKIRFEHVHGVYLPAGNSPNPYGKHYTNNLAQLLFYVKI